ncbi:GTPase ObgE [candidate division KSB1 bacterium]|nr:GTPase ObgE [candidate division KSB1 bacterium]
MSLFIDRAKIEVKAGNGGKGCISFRREKYVPRGGPDGGDGGDGGSIIFQVDPNMQTLLDFHYLHSFEARRGEHGKGANKTGRRGADLIIRVPAGTMVFDQENHELLVDLVESDQEFIIARGGRGGRGNAHFKTATHQAPRFAQDGENGEERKLLLELKLIADVGLVGFPNAGKSTLLSRLSAARPKIADYPFTTLAPNLGLVQVNESFRFVMADIPGLIEGAHEGKGLGHQFLNHILRTKILVLLVDSQSADILNEYQILINEMEKFSPELSKKEKILVITKSDLIIDELAFKSIAQQLKDQSYCLISAVTGNGLTDLLQLITKVLKNQN